MLSFLGPKKEAMTINQIADEMNLHPNSVREIIDALVEHGVVAKRRAQISGRGRPAWLYEVVVPESYATFHNNISDLMIATAKTLIKESHDPAQRARSLGKTWAHEILQRVDTDELDFTDTSPKAIAYATNRIRLFLSSQGFNAYHGDDDTNIQLRACPFLTSDSRTQALICSMHGAMLAELIRVLSHGNLRTNLSPFYCGDCCLVSVLGPAQSD